MEQTTQKLPLPIKTKIAAKWLRIYSIIYLIFAGGLYILSFPFASMGGYPPKPYFLGLLLLLLFPLFILLFASGVLRGHKWAWRGVVILLSIIILIPMISFIIGIFWEGVGYIKEDNVGVIKEDVVWLILLGTIHSIFVIIPFILFLLDRKNFWKIAS